MNQDPLRSYLKRVAKNDEDLGQLSDLALQNMRKATELFVDEIGMIISEHLANHGGTLLTSDTLKRLLHASTSPTFEPIMPVLQTLAIPAHREKPAKRRINVPAPSRSKITQRTKTNPAHAPATVMQPATAVNASHIEEDDDYDASE
ncbi:hypothetical protein H310_05231 [Aphanomyces invadans]|uniref:Transcription factor CBF/NF-Y/archaeal histone domain-containing protein n=1 Tax=Aphanomyces invadans TaxID=157072 RepID=A0A024U927_9STRA|nr:hypothetical protein H310_05231 [Aphanomyces invadans]ETW02730.1 hypothetical protein H310_05231 [Aphanomyces invadans]|eukprot:XP_008868114.1 hypothetical protein H310_05231 [Aphanomyces invadans]